MLKYIKYEIKGTYKYILGVLALILLLSTSMYLYVVRSEQGRSMIGAMFVNLSAFIIFGAVLTTFLYIVGSFRKELYEDRGYLTFTLPLSGNKILASKLLVALLYFILLAMVLVTFPIVIFFTFNTMMEISLSELSHSITRFISVQQIIFALFTSLLSLMNILIFIYFSMTLSRVTFRNKKIGGMWFIIFLIISGLFSYGQFIISDLFPYYINLNTLDIATLDGLREQLMVNMNTGVGFFSMHNPGMPVANIASSIFAIAITIGAFLGTGYLIENKIDL